MAQNWVCTVCGYIHEGDQAPDVCPVCGMDAGAFIPEAGASPPPASPAPTRWRCVVCGHEQDGPAAPDECVVCGAGGDCFEPLANSAPAVASGSHRPDRILIIGGGVAGVAAAEGVREVAATAEITLLAREPDLPYYRINITRYLAGEITEEQLPLHPAGWYDERKIQLRLDAEASALDPGHRLVRLASGEDLAYDRLILTGGAHVFIPPIPGAGKLGVCGLRTIHDARELLARAKAGGRIICIGGGILGLETAAAIVRQGGDVTLLEGFGWLLPRQLNESAGQLLAEHAQRAGIKLISGAKTAEIIGEPAATGVRLASGDIIPADMVVMTTGIRANSGLARQAGLAVNQGVVVDDLLRTSDENIYAAGDIAEHRGVCYGLWGPAQSQGRIAGLNAGGARGEFTGIPRSTTLKVLGVGLVSIGPVTPEDASFTELGEQCEGQYYRFLLRDNRLRGAILLGDTAAAAAAKRLVETGDDLSGLLRERPTASQFARRLASGVACTPAAPSPA